MQRPFSLEVMMRHVWPAIFALVVVLASVACENVNAPNGPIKSFTADKMKVSKGMTTKLTAVFDSGTGMIDNGIGEVTSGAAVETMPLMANTTFNLTVVNDMGA